MPTASDSGVQTALTSLFPPSILPSGVPPKLTSHAVTLLNLSRQRAPNLKPEEEIARAHACAEIACRKLRVQLRLPNTKTGVGAPAKPGVYKKLLAFLEGRLDDVGISTPKSGRKRNAEETFEHGRTPGTGSVKRARKDIDLQGREDEDMSDTHVQATPTKKKSNAIGGTELVDNAVRSSSTLRTPQKARKSATSDGATDNTAAPDYVMPSIRNLCRAFGTASLAPHVYTGTCIVLRHANLWPVKHINADEATSRTDIESLLIALFIMVLTRMQRGKMTTPVYTSTCSTSISILGYTDSGDVQTRIEAWIAKINHNGWAVGQDWWDSVPEGVLTFTGQPLSQTVDDDGGGDEEARSLNENRANTSKTSGLRKVDMLKRLEEPDPQGVLLPGLGTMMQDAVDWLSEDRKSDFEEWKEDLLQRLRNIDRSGIRKGRAIAV